jgi:hypothetical protein
MCRRCSDELEKAWWNEQAELSSGPAAAGKGAIPEEEAASTQWQVSHLAVCQQLLLPSDAACFASAHITRCN